MPLLVEQMIAALRKLARRACRLHSKLDTGGRGKDLVGKGLGFHGSVFGTK